MVKRITFCRVVPKNLDHIFPQTSFLLAANGIPLARDAKFLIIRPWQPVVGLTTTFLSANYVGQTSGCGRDEVADRAWHWPPPHHPTACPNLPPGGLKSPAYWLVRND